MPIRVIPTPALAVVTAGRVVDDPNAMPGLRYLQKVRIRADHLSRRVAGKIPEAMPRKPDWQDGMAGRLHAREPLGTSASTVTPPSSDAIVSVPPSANIRSRIPVRPKPSL